MSERKKIKDIIHRFFFEIIDKSLKEWIISAYLYGSAVDDTFIKNDSNIDIMLIVQVNQDLEIDTDKLHKFYALHTKFVKENQLPFEIYTYGIDEIPTNGNYGYSLLKSIFIYDYFEKAKHIFGKKILKNFYVPDAKKVSIQVVNELKRGLRQMMYKSSYLSKKSVLERMVGDRAGNTVHVSEDLFEYFDNNLRWACVSMIFSQKAFLRYNGKQVSGKTKIFTEYLKNYQNIPNRKEVEEIFDWWKGHKSKEYKRWGLSSNKDFTSLEPNLADNYTKVCLRNIEFISKKLEEDYNGDNRYLATS